MPSITGKLEGRCVTYSRVSTRHDEQTESIENQESLFKNFLKENPDLHCVERYSDVESGKSDERPDFLRMMDRLMAGDIDYLLVKDSNRLCRSTEITASMNRLSQKYDFNVVLLMDNQIFDPTNRSERLLNSIKSAVAEDYVYQQSELGKLAHMQKCKERRLSTQNEVYGFRYNKDTGKMEIQDEEAEIIRYIYEEYVYRETGVNELARKLAEKGIKGTRSKKQLTARTLTQWLTNPAYKGKMVMNKSYTKLMTGVGAKSQRIARPKEEWISVSCPAIISEQLFDLAQEIREERIHHYKGNVNQQSRFKGTHIFSGKIFCGSCGTQFYHYYTDRAKTVGAYKDYFYRKSKKDGEQCNNENYNKIYEDTLIDIVKGALNMVMENNKEIFNQLHAAIKEAMIEEMQDSSKIEAYTKQLERLKKEKERYYEVALDAPAEARKYYYERANEIELELKGINKKIGEVKETEKDYDMLEARMKEIQKSLEQIQRVEVIDRSIVEAFIHKIIIEENGEIIVYLKAGISYKAKAKTYKEEKEIRRKNGSLFHIRIFEIDQIKEQIKDNIKRTKQIILIEMDCEIFNSKESRNKENKFLKYFVKFRTKIGWKI